MAEIFFRPRAIRGFKLAGKGEQEKIKIVINVLRQGNFPPHTKKLGGHEAGYRVRIGRWRVLFALNNNEIDVVDIFIKKNKSDYQRHA